MLTVDDYGVTENKDRQTDGERERERDAERHTQR